jgi:trehalose/maltose transport system permease protein
MRRGRLGRAVVLLLVAGFALGPLAWLVRLSVTPEAEIHRYPPTLLPTSPTLSHYVEIMSDGRFWRQAGNSLVVCLVSTSLALGLGAMGAYVLARYRFGAKEIVLTGCLALHLLPGVASMTAVYRAAEHLNAFDSLLLVALLKAGGVTMALWILYATFRNVPERLEQAAALDGLSRAATLWRVTLPLAGPGLLAAGLLMFIQSWNTFFLPFLLLETPEKMTLTVGLYRYFGEHGFAPGHVAAYLLLAIVPVVTLFFAFRHRLWRRLAF